MAQKWLSRCQCAKFWDANGPKWYPRRLLDIQNVKRNISAQNEESNFPSAENEGLNESTVRLVESQLCDLETQQNDRYVTLSHCWGKPENVKNHLKLTVDNEEKLSTNGIQLGAFPETFRDAILFASRLEKVGYIWIDSLCIKQRNASIDDGKDAQRDWLEQSRVMDRIYGKSFLNIAATSAEDGNGGLYLNHRPKHTWDDLVYLNLERCIHDHVPGEECTTCAKRWKLIDVSFWRDLDNAPLNRRGWVVQERCLASRVLHFCVGHVVWECCEFNGVEGHPAEIPIFDTKNEQIQERSGLKSSNPEIARQRLMTLANQGHKGPADLYLYEFWKNIVDTYSRTQLSFSNDKLIALSGTARWFSTHTKSKYVAGMWEQYLECQLLWRVEPVYKNGAFLRNVISRRRHDRAPSFSWTSIDAPQGIVYGEAANYVAGKGAALLFKVVDWCVELSDPANEFGLIQNGCGYVQLEVHYLKRIKLQELEPSYRVLYGWLLDDDPFLEFHPNVFLDAPKIDKGIFSEEAEIYCVPAAWEGRIDRHAQHLVCFLLKLTGAQEEHLTFRRIGLTKLSDFLEHLTQEFLLKERMTQRILIM